MIYCKIQKENEKKFKESNDILNYQNPFTTEWRFKRMLGFSSGRQSLKHTLTNDFDIFFQMVPKAHLKSKIPPLIFKLDEVN